jgi:hypothetical protein
MSLIIKKNTTFKIPRTGGTISTEIVAATAGNLSITFAGYNNGPYINQIYGKSRNTAWFFSPQDLEDGFLALQWGFYPNIWSLILNNGGDISTLAWNLSANSLIIPTAGWYYIYSNAAEPTITIANA